MKPITFVLLLCTAVSASHADSLTTAPPTPSADPRIRDTPYESGTVYALSGRIGYQIDIEFEPGEHYIGLAAGDVNGISFESQDNHVFLKPKAPRVATNLTILTDRRHYYFDYRVISRLPSAFLTPDTLYALRFHYPQEIAHDTAEKDTATHISQALTAPVLPLNRHYSYCGARTLKPTAAFDDGVRTRLAFAARAELPAIYVQNDDGTESLVNFTVTGDGLTVQRIAHRFILRRGTLKGCIVNEVFDGAGERLATGTVSADVHRDTPTARP